MNNENNNNNKNIKNNNSLANRGLKTNDKSQPSKKDNNKKYSNKPTSTSINNKRSEQNQPNNYQRNKPQDNKKNDNLNTKNKNQNFNNINNGAGLLNNMKNRAAPNVNNNANNNADRIKKLAKVAKHIPIPPVKAAGEAIDKLGKTGIGKSLLSGGLKNRILGGNEQGSTTANIITLIKYRKVLMIGIPLLLFIIIFVSLFSTVAASIGDLKIDLNSGICVMDYQDDDSNKPDEECSYSGEDEKAFYERVKEVKKEFDENNKSFNPLYISGFYVVLSKERNATISYNSLTKEKIQEIANAMFKEEDGSYTFDKEIFKSNLKKNIFPQYIKKGSYSYYDFLINEIFNYVKRYNEYYGNNEQENNDDKECSSGNTCTYTIDGKTVKGLKIRLGQCAPPYGQGVNFKSTGEPLVDFEHYVLGVAYGETNLYYEEAFKTQVIFARTYTLRRNINPAQNIKDNVKVMRNGVCEQVYCDPDTGCYKLNDGDQGGQVRQGSNKNYKEYKGKLPENSKFRSAAATVTGVYFTGGQADFTDTKQKLWDNYANKGYDYKQIIIATAGPNVKIKQASCSGVGGCNSVTKASGDYTNWKQYTGPWTGIHLGNSSETIRSAGCTATSIAMLIVKSGTKTTVEGKFNPGTFVKKLSANGGFTGSGALNWGAISSAAPNFKKIGDVSLTGNKSDKAKQMKDVLDKGYYPIVQLNNGGHWVAVDSVSGSNVTMMDPGSTSTNMWSKYSVKGTIRMVYFKAS